MQKRWCLRFPPCCLMLERSVLSVVFMFSALFCFCSGLCPSTAGDSPLPHTSPLPLPVLQLSLSVAMLLIVTSLQHFEGSRPEWCISTIYILLEIHHSGREPSISALPGGLMLFAIHHFVLVIYVSLTVFSNGCAAIH